MPDEQEISTPVVRESSEQQVNSVREAASMVRAFTASLLSKDRANQFVTTLMLLARRDPLIARASKESIVAAMMACAQLDLLPNTPEQHAYLIPFKNQRTGGVDIQFQVGYKGLIALAYRSAQIKLMAAELVFDGDKFKVKLGTARQLVHEPNFEVDRTDYTKVTHAYTTAVLNNGEKVFDVMTRSELDKVRDSAKAKSTDAPWQVWPGPMAKKTSIKRASKLLPSSTVDNRLALAAQFDSWAEANGLQIGGAGEVLERPRDLELESATRVERIRKAEERRKELEAENFEAHPVAAIE